MSSVFKQGQQGSFPGGDGESVEAIAANANDAANSAEALGGGGGEGDVDVAGGSGGGGIAIATTTLSTALGSSATATAMGGAAGSGQVGAGNGGSANATATATNATGAATSQATATAGTGVESGPVNAKAIAKSATVATATVGAIEEAGGSFSASLGDSVKAVADGGSAAGAQVMVQGGAANTAGGGNADVVDAVGGKTNDGALTLTQDAMGGSGFAGDEGAGGAATSSLTFKDKTSASIDATITAQGGAGGAAQNAFGGGDATAILDLTARGSGLIYGSAAANAGGGGQLSSTGGYAVTGTATASAIVAGTGSLVEAVGAADSIGATPVDERAASATATATNTGRGDALAQAVATGATGAASATSNAAKGGVAVTAVANQPNARGIGQEYCESEATTDKALDAGQSSVFAAYAFGGADLAFAGLPSNLSVFSKAGLKLMGSAALGANQSAAVGDAVTIYHSSVDWRIGTAQAPAADKLDIGLDDTNLVGVGFSKLDFTVTENGAKVRSFVTASLAKAQTFFANHLLSLGLWKNNHSGALNVEVSLAVTLTKGGAGFGVDLMSALAPATAAAMERGSPAQLGVPAFDGAGPYCPTASPFDSLACSG